MLPRGVKLSRFRNEGQSLVVSFVDNNAKFHKPCRNSCDKYHYERALQRSAKKMCMESFSSEATLSHKGTHSTYESLNFVEATCFFCDEADDEKNLRKASTMEFDCHIRATATTLGDEKLLAKLSQEDMVAIEARYHKACLTKLYKHLRDTKSNESPRDKECPLIYGIALSEVINYIRFSKKQPDASPVFKLIDLKKLLISNMKRYGISPDGIHSTRLKEQLLNHIPGLQNTRKAGICCLAFEKKLVKLYLMHVCMTPKMMECALQEQLIL